MTKECRMLNANKISRFRRNHSDFVIPSSLAFVIRHWPALGFFYTDKPRI
jgi:hypothetical protein